VSVVDVAGRVTMGGGSNTLRETLRELTSARRYASICLARETHAKEVKGAENPLMGV
jgi:hypothetical protein